MNWTSDAEFVADVFIQEGACPAPGVIIAACTVGDDDDAPKNKVGVRRDGAWLHFGLSGEAILSVDADEAGAAYVLGENGSVVRFNWREPSNQDELKASRQAIANPEVLRRGPLRRLRMIGGDVVCAGSVGQVYVLAGQRFDTLPTLEIGGQAVTIEDIAGDSVSDFIAVTSDGYAARFDGTRWEVLDLPTNASLTSICRVGVNYAIAGKLGTVLLGNRAQWLAVVPLDPARSYWGIASFDGVVCVAHLGGVDSVRHDGLTSMTIHNQSDLQFTVLRSALDGIWSFADKTIGHIVGDQWRLVMTG